MYMYILHRGRIKQVCCKCTIISLVLSLVLLAVETAWNKDVHVYMQCNVRASTVVTCQALLVGYKYGIIIM